MMIMSSIDNFLLSHQDNKILKAAVRKGSKNLTNISYKYTQTSPCKPLIELTLPVVLHNHSVDDSHIVVVIAIAIKYCPCH
jgi:hypothetical protein